MFTNRELMRIAMEQSARDMNCSVDDFLKADNVIVEGSIGKGAKRYYKEPIACNFVSYGNNIVALTQPEYARIVHEYIDRFEFYHCFETPNMHWLSEKLMAMGQKVCFMAEYYLSDIRKLRVIECDYDVKILRSEDFSDLYKKQWSNALCKERKELDVLGAGAYDAGQLVGLAGCSADCDEMWQIGVDVLPGYRRNGIAAAMTSTLTKEILKRGKVPFYCSAWSNIPSVRNAIKSGFVPAWVEMTVKSAATVDEINEVDCIL